MSRNDATLMVHILAVAYLFYVALTEILRVIPASEWMTWLTPAVLLLVTLANQRRKRS